MIASGDGAESNQQPIAGEREIGAGLTSVDAKYELSDAQLTAVVDAPDGGFRAWSTVCGAWLVEFSVVGIAASFGAMHEFYAKEYLSDYSLSDIAWIGSVQIFMQYVLGLVSGKIMDTGRFRLVSIGGSLVFLFSLFMLSLARHQQYYQIFLAQAIGMGIGVGMVFMPSMGVAANHFTRRRSLAMGIISTANSFGGFLFSVMFSHFFRGSIGFAMGIRIGGFICLGCLAIAQVLMHQYPKSTNIPHRDPAKIDIQLSTTPLAEHSSSSQKTSIKTILKNRPYVLTVLGGFFFNLGLFYPIFNVQLFARDEGFASTALIGWLLGTMDLSSCVGRVVLTYLGDRFGPVRTIVPCALISGVLAMIMFLCKNSAAIVTFCVLYGFFSGGVFALLFPAVLSWDTNMQSSGLRLGIACVPAGIASLVGAPLSTALAQIGGTTRTWYAGCVFAGLMEMLAAVLFFVATALGSPRRKFKL